jgi:hypothetical protein
MIACAGARSGRLLSEKVPKTFRFLSDTISRLLNCVLTANERMRWKSCALLSWLRLTENVYSTVTNKMCLRSCKRNGRVYIGTRATRRNFSRAFLPCC